MNEDTYVPITRAYGLTGFSLALLSGAATGWSGRRCAPGREARVTDGAAARSHASGSGAADQDFEVSGGFYAWQGTRWAQFLFEHVGAAHERIRRGRLPGRCAGPGGCDARDRRRGADGPRPARAQGSAGPRRLGERRRAIRGLALGWFAAAVGVGSLGQPRFGYPSTAIRDILVQVHLDRQSPLSAGVGGRVRCTTGTSSCSRSRRGRSRGGSRDGTKAIWRSTGFRAEPGSSWAMASSRSRRRRPRHHLLARPQLPRDDRRSQDPVERDRGTEPCCPRSRARRLRLRRYFMPTGDCRLIHDAELTSVSR